MLAILCNCNVINGEFGDDIALSGVPGSFISCTKIYILVKCNLYCWKTASAILSYLVYIDFQKEARGLRSLGCLM